MKYVETNSTSHHKHNPECPMHTWQASLSQARRLLHKHSWQEAAMEYRFAFEAAEQIIGKQENPIDNVKRYIRTAMEFAYALRMGCFPCDLQALVALVKFRLEEEKWLCAPIGHLIGPLEDVSFSPKPEVSRWMETLFAIEEAKKSSIH